MKPSRYDRDDLGGLGTVELLALGLGLWLGLIVSWVGAGIGRAWRAVSK